MCISTLLPIFCILKYSIHIPHDHFTIWLNTFTLFINLNSLLEDLIDYIQNINSINYHTSAWIDKLDIDLDFDFDIHGSIIASVISLLKNQIKNLIKPLILQKIQEVAQNESKKLISDLINKLPIFVPIGGNGLALDYSLLSAPRISNNYLIVSSYGGIINLNIPVTQNPPYPLPDLNVDYDRNGKNVQLFFSSYSVSTAANTLYLSNMLHFDLKSEDIPKDSPIQLNTSSLNSIIKGLEAKYGKNVPVNFCCFANKEVPHIDLADKKFAGFLYGHCSVVVRLQDGKMENALEFNSTIDVEANAVLLEGGKVSAKVENADIKDSVLVATTLPEVNIKNIEDLFNFSILFALPTINDILLKQIQIKLPEIAGITFEDSTLDINNQYVEFNVSPKFGCIFELLWITTFDEYFDRVNKKDDNRNSLKYLR